MDMSRDESFAAQRHGRRSLQTFEAMLDGGSPAVRDQQISKVFKRRSTALNVQKSIQLLDESVGSPSTKGWRTPGGTLKHTSYTPRLLSSGTKFDVSTRFGPTPKKTPQGNKSFQRSFHDDSFQSSFHNTSGLRPLQEEDMTEEITTTNVGLLLEEDPGVSASKGLFEDFLQCHRAHPSEAELFLLVEEYQKTCKEQVVMLKKLVTHASRQEEKMRKTFIVLHQLYEEEATWKLIRSLFKDRHETCMREECMMEEGEEDIQVVQGIYQSDEKIVNALFDRDQSVREAQLVVDWLESCAQDDCENFADNIKFFSDRAVGYENARHRLQNQQTGVPAGAERNLITELDPDAPIRQNRLLDDLDKEDEDRLLQYIFVCLRAGQLEKAQKMCSDCGQAWRAATLEGWKLFHDPNFEGVGPEGQRRAVIGNPHRDIWKTVCWNMSQDARVGIYEKAIYSALSGNLRGVLPVCKSWLDYVWAYFRVFVDRKVEDEIRLKTTLSRSLAILPGEYWEKNLTTRSVFKEIEANEVMQKESMGLYHLIQKYVIVGDISGLLDLLYERVRQQGQDVSLHALRFMAHFVLFLRTSEQNTKEELCNSILECYVERLIRDKHYNLIAYYVSKLPLNAQVHWYALFLEGITNKDERQHYLDLAEEAGLDLAAVTKKVVENIRMKSDVDFTSLHEAQESVDTVISEEDRLKIEAIDWLVFDIGQRAEALKQANAVMRTFIALKKIDAARAVFEKLPPDSVDVVHRTWLQQTGTTMLPLEDKNAVREYLCFKAYLDAMESFNDWIQHYHHGQPTQPAPPEGGSFTDRVAYEHRMKQYDQERERWHHNLLMQTQTTKDHIYNVLLFADGGWMVDQAEEEGEESIADRPDSDPLRHEQMDCLRHLVLPGLVFLLQTVLHTSEQYQECVRLADILAAEQNKLYQVFRQDELQRVLHLLRESSLKLLDQGRGPLGYERN